MIYGPTCHVSRFKCAFELNYQKTYFRTCALSKIQISRRIRTVRSEPSLGAFRKAKDAKFLHADNEDSDQTARMRNLIRVSVVRSTESIFSHVSAYFCLFVLKQ